MRIFNTGQISNEEKQSILEKHKSVYNGYRSVYPTIPNEQPLHVYDPAQDKIGATMTNSGEVKPYTNYRINESKEVCSECGGMMYEGECNECGWKGDIQELSPMDLMKGDKYKYNSPSFEDEIEFDTEVEDESGGKPMFKFKGKKAHHLMGDTDVESFISSLDEEKEMCSECGGMMYEGECNECGWKGEMGEGYKTGHLDDIYKVNDLGDSDFDYVEGGGNKYGTFEKMHHMKEAAASSNAPVSLGKHYSDVKEPYDFVSDGPVGDGKTLRVRHMDEQGMFGGGGHAPDFDMMAEPAYDFESDGPEMGDEPYDEEANDMDLDKSKEWDAYDFESNGPTDAYPMYEDEFTDLIDMDNELEDEREELEEKEYEVMTSAFSDDEELDEQIKFAKISDIGEQDVSGVQGLYGDMEPAYDFISTGAGKAGPYQTRNEGETEEQYLPQHVWDDAHKKGHMKTHKELGIDSSDDFDEDELEVDFDEFDPRDKSWEEITAHTGEDEFSHLDEDIKESVTKQKVKIMEMFNRMKVIK